MLYKYNGKTYKSIDELYKDQGIEMPKQQDPYATPSGRRDTHNSSTMFGINASRRPDPVSTRSPYALPGLSMISEDDSDTSMRDDADDVQERSDSLNEKVDEYTDKKLDEVDTTIPAPPPAPDQGASAADLMIASQGDYQKSTTVGLDTGLKRIRRRSLLTIPGG